MSQTLSNVSTGSAVGGLWYGSGGKNVSAQGAVTSFDQTLLSMMSGGLKSQEGQLSSQLAMLAGLVETGEGVVAEGEEGGLDGLLQGLLEQLDQLDQALIDNPDLLAVLQGWIQNVQQFLQNHASEQPAENGGTGTLLPELAEHPQTVRFSVQDALLQLAALSGAQNSAATASAANSLQATAMMESLQSLMTAAGLNNDVKSANGKQTENLLNSKGIALNEQSAVSSQSGQAIGIKAGDNLNQVLTSSADGDVTIKTGAASSSTIMATGEEAALDDNASSEGDHSLSSGNIVTAGQLALRDSAASAVKPAAPQVPVEKFGQEMSRFLINKLEIVKAGGMSEARISLNPEHLGQVDVKITMQNGQMVAQFVTEHAFAKESLESQMAQLRTALQSQGLQVGKLEVTQNASLSSHMYQDGRQQGNGTNQQQQHGKRRETVLEEELIGIHDLNDEWNEWISGIRERETGSSFVAKA